MWAWRDVTLVQHTHTLHKILLCIHVYARKRAQCASPHTPLQKSRQSGGDQLFFCAGRSQLRHLKRTEHGAWRRLPPLWFFTLRRSISLMQSCRALASIKSNIYQEIKRGERETGQRMVLWHIEEMLRWRDLEKTEQKNSPTENTAAVIYRCFTTVERVYLFVGCLCESVYQAEHHLLWWCVHIHAS